MFKFLKDKLKGAIDKFTKKVEEEAQKQEIEQPIKTTQKKEEEKKIKEKPQETKKEIIKEIKELPIEEKKEEKHSFFDFLKKKKEELPEKEEKKGIFQAIKEKVTTKVISPDQFDELFFDLELVLLENNVAVEVIEKIKKDLKMNLVDTPLKRSAIDESIREALKGSIESLFDVEKIDLIERIKEKKKKPFVIAFFGTNGAGKTTTIAKVAYLLLKNKFKVVLVAGDTWRSAAIEQLEEWGKQLGVKVIKHNYGSDPASVCFDSLRYSEAHNIDVVLIDTAGRQHSNINLMQEMKKIVKVANPDLKIFIGESIIGNDVVSQVDDFNKTIGIDGIILTKGDVDEKGGAIISISYVIGKPVLYIGIGQRIVDIKNFDKNEILESLGF